MRRDDVVCASEGALQWGNLDLHWLSSVVCVVSTLGEATAVCHITDRESMRAAVAAVLAAGCFGQGAACPVKAHARQLLHAAAGGAGHAFVHRVTHNGRIWWRRGRRWRIGSCIAMNYIQPMHRSSHHEK